MIFLLIFNFDKVKKPLWCCYMVNLHWPQGALYLHQVHRVRLPCLQNLDKSVLRKLPLCTRKVQGPLSVDPGISPTPCDAEHYWAGQVVEGSACQGTRSNHPSLPCILEQGARQATDFCRSSCASDGLHQVHGGAMGDVPGQPSWPEFLPPLHERESEKTGAWDLVPGHLRWHSVVQVLLHNLCHFCMSKGCGCVPTWVFSIVFSRLGVEAFLWKRIWGQGRTLLRFSERAHPPNERSTTKP